jgi:hypothetical protein
VKPAAETPCGIVRPAGTVAAPVFELVSETTVPPVGAGPVSVTAPRTRPLPTTLSGLIVRDESVWPPSGAAKSRQTTSHEGDASLRTRLPIPFLEVTSYE